MASRISSPQTDAATPSVSRWSVIFDCVSIVLYALLAFRYFQLWAFAGPEDARAVSLFGMLILFEFIMMHAGLMMLAFPLKVMIPFYGVFVWAFTHTVEEGGMQMVYLYLGLVVNRALIAFQARIESKKKKKREQKQELHPAAQSALLALLSYIFALILLWIFSSRLPALALDESYLSQHEMDLPFEPKYLMFFGVAYYVQLVFWESLLLLRRFKKKR
jgi:small-conductance mechanosensitive channel